jgi:uncharacterized phage protein (TIGR01671 family)
MREIKFRAWLKDKQVMTSSFELFDNDEDYLLNGDGLHVRNAEIMQYTGLKDKNGKEIYEGDIVTLWNGLYDLKEHYVVRWYQFGFDYSNPSNPDETHYFPQDKIEVIGNIYENPELLEPKSEELAS